MPPSNTDNQDNQPPATPIEQVEDPTPPAENVAPSTSPGFAQPIQPSENKNRKRILIFLAIFLLVLGIAAVAYLLFIKDSPSSTPTTSTVTKSKKSQNSSLTQSTHFLFANKDKKEITLTDKAAKTLYTVSYADSGQSFADVLSVSPSGDTLLMLSSYTSTPKYLLVTSQGKKVELPKKTIDALGLAKNATAGYSYGWPSIFLTSVHEAYTTGCDGGSRDAPMDCTLSKLNLDDGSTKVILAAAAPVTTSTGEAMFAVRGFSPNKQEAYMEITGPTDVAKDEHALFSVNLSTGKITKILDVPAEHSFSLSPDGKLMVYVNPSENPNKVVLHIVDIAKPKSDVAVPWMDTMFYGGAEASWAWSPDGTKLAFLATKHADKNNGSETVAYLDIAKKSITSLKTVDDSSLASIQHLGWVDDEQVAYDYYTTTNPNNFADPASSAVFVQPIAKEVSTKLTVPSTYLTEIIRY